MCWNYIWYTEDDLGAWDSFAARVQNVARDFVPWVRVCCASISVTISIVSAAVAIVTVVPIIISVVSVIALVAVPVILGAGKPLFKDVKKMNLKLLETRDFKNGIVLLKYRPA